MDDGRNAGLAVWIRRAALAVDVAAERADVLHSVEIGRELFDLEVQLLKLERQVLQLPLHSPLPPMSEDLLDGESHTGVFRPPAH